MCRVVSISEGSNLLMFHRCVFTRGILGAGSILEIFNFFMFLVCVFTHGKCGALKIFQGSGILFIK